MCAVLYNSQLASLSLSRAETKLSGEERVFPISYFTLSASSINPLHSFKKALGLFGLIRK